MSTDLVRDHLEKTFGDAYRKEIEQEENVWRSLPFFAAALALQLAAIAPLREWVATATGPVFLAAIVLLGLAGAATLAALVFVLRPIAPPRFAAESRHQSVPCSAPHPCRHRRTSLHRPAGRLGGAVGDHHFGGSNRRAGSG